MLYFKIDKKGTPTPTRNDCDWFGMEKSVPLTGMTSK